VEMEKLPQIVNIKMRKTWTSGCSLDFMVFCVSIFFAVAIRDGYKKIVRR